MHDGGSNLYPYPAEGAIRCASTFVAPLGLEGSAWVLVYLRGVTSGAGQSRVVCHTGSAGVDDVACAAVVAQTQTCVFSFRPEHDVKLLLNSR